MKSYKENELKALFQESQKQPPLDFTEAVMAGLPESQPIPDYLKAPLLGRWQWLVVGLVSLALLLFGLSSLQDSASGVTYLPDLEKYTPTMPAYSFDQLPDFSFPGAGLAALALAGFICLYLFDRFLRKKISL